MKKERKTSKTVSLILTVIAIVVSGVFAVNGTGDRNSEKNYPQTEKSTYSQGETYTYNIPDTASEDYYTFRSKSTLSEHYKKHKADTRTSSTEEYLYRANYVINNDDSLHKTEKEDGDDIYYLVSTNELVIVSTDGYIRTYFCPENGKKYFDKQ